MILPDNDLWRMAKRLIDVYGKDAIGEAAKRADEFQVAGDRENAAVWNRIFGFVTELLNQNADNNHDQKH